MKRTDYINWDEYFMGIALLTAMRSKDPSSQVGACIVSPENKILSLGYNGMPIGCDDDAMPWEREGDPLSAPRPSSSLASRKWCTTAISTTIRIPVWQRGSCSKKRASV